jgi:beta-phosphoglucomutase
MDGVIVDSMPYHYLAWYEALIPYGVRVSCFDVFSKEGERWDRTLVGLLSRRRIRPTRELLSSIFTARQRLFKRYFKRFIFPNSEETLRRLKAEGYQLGLVTGTPYREVVKILPARMARLFDALVAGDAVKKGKPHPDPYLAAARSLRRLPQECAVVENAPYGIESAKRAGMYCIAVSTSLPGEYLRKADRIIKAIDQVPGIVGCHHLRGKKPGRRSL